MGLFILIILFCFNHNTAWRNVFKWVLPHRLKNSHSGEDLSKKAIAPSQIEHFRERATCLEKDLLVRTLSLHLLTRVPELPLASAFSQRHVRFSYPQVPFHSITQTNWLWAECELDRYRSLNLCQILIFIWPMNSQLMCKLFLKNNIFKFKVWHHLQKENSQGA